MMNSIVAEKLISFKELEQKVFKYICELGCEITRIMLESYDRELATTSAVNAVAYSQNQK